MFGVDVFDQVTFLLKALTAALVSAGEGGAVEWMVLICLPRLPFCVKLLPHILQVKVGGLVEWMVLM